MSRPDVIIDLCTVILRVKILVRVHESANVVWERADWDVLVDCSDGLFSNWKKLIDYGNNVVLCKCFIAKSVSISFGKPDFANVL